MQDINKNEMKRAVITKINNKISYGITVTLWRVFKFDYTSKNNFNNCALYFKS